MIIQKKEEQYEKNALIPILLLVNLCVMMIACSSEEEYIQPDSIPGSFCIEILNANGDNLLDPNTENNLWQKGNVTIIWNEGEYELNAKTETGTVSVKTFDFGDGSHSFLTFFFYVGKVIFPTDIVMEWEDGSRNTIVFDYDSENLEYRKNVEGGSYTVMTVIL